MDAPRNPRPGVSRGIATDLSASTRSASRWGVGVSPGSCCRHCGETTEEGGDECTDLSWCAFSEAMWGDGDAEVRLIADALYAFGERYSARLDRRTAKEPS